MDVALLSARAASASDVVEVTRLWDLAVAALQRQRGGPMLAASLADGFDRSELATQITPDERAVVVGLIDDVPVGIAYAALRRIGGSRVAGLELLFVEPPARGIGVADAMLEVVLERCASWGVTAIDAPALPGDRAAKSFFETHGFKARLLVMQRDQAPAGNGVST